MDAAKQRVLVHILAHTARAKVGLVTDSTFMQVDVDTDIADASEKMELAAKKGPKKRKDDNGLQHENFSVALIKTLPNLLAKFKFDPTILESLTSLPRYLSKFLNLIKLFYRVKSNVGHY